MNIVALLYGGAMLVNFAWPRVASNPKPNQTGGLLSFGLGFLNDIPILWTVAIVIALIGAIYYLVAGRTKAFARGDGAITRRRPAGRGRPGARAAGRRLTPRGGPRRWSRAGGLARLGTGADRLGRAAGQAGRASGKGRRCRHRRRRDAA